MLIIHAFNSEAAAVTNLNVLIAFVVNAPYHVLGVRLGLLLGRDGSGRRKLFHT